MKSHVTLFQKQCLICGENYDTGEIGIHKRLSQTLDRHTVVGNGVCPKDQAKLDEGYIALVGVDGDPNVRRDAKRTGELVHVRASAWHNLFNVPIPPQRVCFVEVAVIDKLKALSE